MKPGEYLLQDEDIVANAGRAAVRLVVAHTRERPLPIGSHFHFFEVNRALQFDRPAAYGRRLNIPAGTAVRFEPGEEKEIELTDFGGLRVVRGFNNLVDGSVESMKAREVSLQKARASGFLFEDGGKA